MPILYHICNVLYSICFFKGRNAPKFIPNQEQLDSLARLAKTVSDAVTNLVQEGSGVSKTKNWSSHHHSRGRTVRNDSNDGKNVHGKAASRAKRTVHSSGSGDRRDIISGSGGDSLEELSATDEDDGEEDSYDEDDEVDGQVRGLLASEDLLPKLNVLVSTLTNLLHPNIVGGILKWTILIIINVIETKSSQT